MSNRASRAARQRQKRAEKKRDARRASSGSPYRRIGESDQPMACYVNRDFDEEGMASLLVLRRAPGGGHALAAFLIDRWCIGLKDAWGRLDVAVEAFNRMLGRAREHTAMERIEPEAARRMVAAAIRFSHANGFRLPARYERWVALLGGVGDWRTADTSDLGVDGGLRYVGKEADLRSRLISGTVEEFLHQPGVHYIMGMPAQEAPPEFRTRLDAEMKDLEPTEVSFDDGDLDAFDDDEDRQADAEVEKAAGDFRDRMLDAVRQWCLSRGIRPHPRLADAVEMMTEAMLQVPDNGELDPADDRIASQTMHNLGRLTSFESRQDSEALAAALSQVSGFTEQFDSPVAMVAALGLREVDVTDT